MAEESFIDLKMIIKIWRDTICDEKYAEMFVESCVTT